MRAVIGPNVTRRAHRCLLLLALVTTSGCSEPPVAPRLPEPVEGPNPPFMPAPRSYPLRHLDPSWGSGSLIAHLETGLLRIEPGKGEVYDHALQGVWLIDATAGTSRLVLPSQRRVWGMSWSPDGTRLAYSDYNTLFVMDVASGESTPVTTFEYPEGAYDPRWSPDGSTIAFSHIPGHGGWADWGVWTVKPDGSDLTRVALGYIDPAWHPEGLVMRGPGGHEISLWRAASGQVVKIRDLTGFQAGDLEVSPDGNQISITPIHRGALWLMNADGSNLRVLADHVIGRHSWSPDGRSIVFTRDDPTTDVPENGVLWRVDVTSGAFTPVTHH